MFTVDLLKGSGLPLRSSPGKAALGAIPFIVPVLIGAVLVVQYFYTNAIMAATRHNTDRMQTAIQEYAGDIAEYEQQTAAIARTRQRLAEVSTAIGRHLQWSDVLRALTESLPEGIAVKNIELKRNATRTKVADKNDPQILIPKTIIKRTLVVAVYGSPGTATDAAVQTYLTNLAASPVLDALAHDMRITSRYEEDIDDKKASVYEIECPITAQE